MHFLFVFIFLFIINSTDKTLSVNLCEKNGKIRPNFAEIFGKKWDNEQMECENETETDQIANYHQSDQNGLNLANSIRNDQPNEQLNDQQKCEIIHKFHAIKVGIKKRGKYSEKVRNKIEQKIAVKLGISRPKIYKWKKEFNLNKKKINENKFYEKKKREFVERIDEIKKMSKKGKQKQFVEELGINVTTFIKWKKKFGIEMSKSKNAYSSEEKKSKMNDYYKMKNENPSLTDKGIAGLLEIGNTTLKRWKKEKKFVI